jgi:hypothetical protein
MNLRNVTRIVRSLFGAGFVLFGLDGFLHFLPHGPVPPAAMNFVTALFATGYMFPLIKGVEVIAGLMLVSNRYVTLALALLAPNIVNIVALHLFLAPQGMPVAIVFLAAELFLAWSYRDAYAPMLRSRVEPTLAPVHRSPRTASAAA